MIEVTQVRPGMAILIGGQPNLVLFYKHRVLGRKKARVKLGLRNLKTGTTIEKNFLSGTQFDEAELEERSLIYSYSDRENSFFGNEKGEKFEIGNELIVKQRPFLIKKREYQLLFWEEKPISLRLPKQMDFEVLEAPPGVRGNSATNLFKTVRLDGGLRVKVPLFIEKGEQVVIDTETGEYKERRKE